MSRYYAPQHCLVLSDVVFDESGKLVSAWVNNGHWELRKNEEGFFCAYNGADVTPKNVMNFTEIEVIQLTEVYDFMTYNEVVDYFEKQEDAKAAMCWCGHSAAEHAEKNGHSHVKRTSATGFCGCVHSRAEVEAGDGINHKAEERNSGLMYVGVDDPEAFGGVRKQRYFSEEEYSSANSERKVFMNGWNAGVDEKEEEVPESCQTPPLHYSLWMAGYKQAYSKQVEPVYPIVPPFVQKDEYYDEALTELLAELAHQQWSDFIEFIRYQVDQYSGKDGIISPDIYRQWIYQMETPYIALEELEKAKLREKAQQQLALLQKVTEVRLKPFTPRSRLVNEFGPEAIRFLAFAKPATEENYEAYQQALYKRRLGDEGIL